MAQVVVFAVAVGKDGEGSRPLRERTVSKSLQRGTRVCGLAHLFFVLMLTCEQLSGTLLESTS